MLYLGEVRDGLIDQVKGVTFSIRGFLGKDYRSLGRPDAANRPPGKLLFCTIYLAPGDYHRFHAPTECELAFRRYFPGNLLSVNPRVARLLPGLFSVNERAAYFGRWRHGLFSLTAVGATNVGNLRVFCDPTLPLNRDRQKLDLIGRRKEGAALKMRHNEPVTWEKPLEPSVKLGRGQLFGKFLLGSTIVMIFEAPDEFRWSVRPGDTVRMGGPIGGAGSGEGHSVMQEREEGERRGGRDDARGR